MACQDVNVCDDDITSTLGRKIPKIPFPEGYILTKSDIPHPGEVKSTLLKQYQRLIGSLLWYATRRPMTMRL